MGRLDLLVTLDFRMNGTCLHSDVVLPAATWYEKNDISTTDLHPFVHAFNPAIAPPWEARSDWDTFRTLADEFSRLAGPRLGTKRDVVAMPLLHDTPDELAQPLGAVRDWRAGECDPIPGQTMPNWLSSSGTTERSAPRWRRWARWSRSSARHGKASPGSPTRRWRDCGSRTAPSRPAPPPDALDSERADQLCEAILAVSGTTNGRIAIEGMRCAGKPQRHTPVADLVEERADVRTSFRDVGSPSHARR